MNYSIYSLKIHRIMTGMRQREVGSTNWRPSEHTNVQDIPCGNKCKIKGTRLSHIFMHIVIDPNLNI